MTKYIYKQFALIAFNIFGFYQFTLSHNIDYPEVITWA